LAWDCISPRLTTWSARIDHIGELPVTEGPLIHLQVDRTLVAKTHVLLCSSLTDMSKEGVDV
jgi:hypothetical protein